VAGVILEVYIMLYNMVVEADDGRLFSQVLIVEASSISNARAIIAGHFASKGACLLSAENGETENPIWEDIPTGWKKHRNLDGNGVVAASGRIYDMSTNGP
jgi:hypothetical protein